MGFKCGSCSVSLRNKAIKNHLAWICRDSSVFCLSCDKKFSSKNFLQHKSCVTNTQKRLKRNDALKMLVSEVLAKTKMSRQLKGLIKNAVNARAIPTSEAKINSFVDKIKTDDPDFKDEAVKVFLTAAGMLPETPDAAEKRQWHNDCKELMLLTLAGTASDRSHKAELKTFLKTTKSPKIWSNFVEIISKPGRFSSSEVVNLATSVFVEASIKFPPKPDALKVADEWQRTLLDTLRASDAETEHKNELAVIIQKRNVPKEETRFEKFLNNPIRVPSDELKTLLQQIYLQATEIAKKALAEEGKSLRSSKTKKRKKENRVLSGNTSASSGGDGEVNEVGGKRKRMPEKEIGAEEENELNSKRQSRKTSRKSRRSFWFTRNQTSN